MNLRRKIGKMDKGIVIYVREGAFVSNSGNNRLVSRTAKGFMIDDIIIDLTKYSMRGTR